MPVFTIETADGRRLKIEADNQESAVAEADRWSAENPKPAAPAAPTTGRQIPSYDPMGAFTGMTEAEVAPSQMPYSEQMLRSGQYMGEVGKGMASGVGQIGTGIGELL